MAKTINLAKVAKMDFPLAINRQDAFPLDFSSYFTSKQLADEYAAGEGTSYIGQIITVVEGGKVDIYKIGASGALEAIVDAPKSVHQAAAAPKVTDDEFDKGQLWLDTANKHVYILADKTGVDQAVWKRLVDSEELGAKGGGDMMKEDYAKGAPTGYVNSALAADKLTTARNIELSGDVAGTASFDGSSNINIAATLSNVVEAGAYVKVTTDTKGRVIKGEVKLAQSDVTGLPEKLTGLEQADTALGQRIDTVQNAVTALGKKEEYVLKTDLASTSTGKAQANKVAQLNGDGLIDMSLLPSLKLSNTYTATDAPTEASAAQPGDLCCVGTGPVEVYILTKEGAGVLENWKKMSSMDDAAVNALIDNKLSPVSQAANAAQSTADAAKSAADTNTTKITAIEKQIPSFVVNTEILILQGGKADGTYDIK